MTDISCIYCELLENEKNKATHFLKLVRTGEIIPVCEEHYILHTSFLPEDEEDE